MPVDMTYDPEADAVFIRLAEDGKPCEGEEVAPGVVLDFTEDGRITDIEIMPASRLLAPGAWSQAKAPSLSPKVVAAE